MSNKNKRLIDRICDWDNLMEAHRLARRGKRNRFEVVSFEANLWENLAALQMEMLHGTYQVGRYREFVAFEPKRRAILAAPYRDRVAQHAIMNIVAPIWDRSMIADTYACRPGMGTHSGADRTQRWLRGMAATHGESGVWVLKMDVSKFFASIPHALAKAVVRRRVRCAATLRLLDTIIDSTAGPDEIAPVGVPVGNLTSQWIGNLVGNEIDQWAKRTLRLRRYVRYMDDMVVLHHDKAHLLAVREAFRDKLEALGMRFSKAEILSASRGVNFLGYRIWPHHRLLRRQSITRIRRTLARLEVRFAAGDITLTDVQRRLHSWLAHAAHANSYGLRRKMVPARLFARGSGGVEPTPPG